MTEFEFIKKILSHNIVQSIILIVITAIVTHVVDVIKFREEERIKYKSVLGDKISNAYLDTRKLLTDALTYDIYEITDADDATINYESNDFTYYPAFMYDADTIIGFIEKLQNIRKELEPFLDLRTAAGLLALQEYLLKLLVFIKNNNLSEQLHLLGGIIYIDMVKWVKEMDKHLIKKLNRLNDKVYSQNGNRWKIEKKLAMYKYFTSSQLNKLINKGIDNFFE